MSWWRNAFAMPGTSAAPLTERQERMLDRIAREVSDRGMSVPALLFLESVKPLNFVGSQALVFFSPLARTVFDPADYDEFTKLLEDRGSIELLARRIEAADAKTDARAGATDHTKTDSTVDPHA